VYIHISNHKSCYFLTTNHLKNWQYHLKLSGMQQRLIQNRNVWIRHKNMKKVLYYKVARRGGRSYSPWRANTALSYTIVRRGEWMASKLCSLSRYNSPWRADYSGWRTWQIFCQEVRFLTPKTQFWSTPIPKLIWNSTYDQSTTWTSISYEFYGLSTLLTTNSTCSIIKSGFKP